MACDKLSANDQRMRLLNQAHRLRWTEQDIEVLRLHWPHAHLVAYHLNRQLPYRTIGAIKAKARKLGLKR